MSKRTPVALVTGFDPFGGEPVNPSQQIAVALHGQTIAAHRVVGAVLPTEFGASLSALQPLLRRHRPALVLALGQAGGREGISLERVAINLIDARIPDNTGSQPVDVRIVDKAANAYFSTLPIKAILQRLHAANIPAALSQSAGTFVCNQVFFGLQHALRRRRGVRGGFVHVPYLPEQAARHTGAPGMPLETMITAIRLCLEVALTTTSDAHYAAGALD
ncbi:MAG: pyroglutamyl-peptidase I [Xanthomonadales bacterium PRO7]|jgi:pyroglutamyl-peptidase|nr:pyroglutamyl-peptidase I [Xanthomonadales bacterium PRO7]HMM57873.1 pyroglutamyl-peptidase I [Rudaea sp.]